uniref:Uncharacterized protein n=1 Tax=Euplotes harpa TaxID=151035 RepID=A0A7S3J8Q2_9SPIT|mmetsp:Transcript_26146/g.30210  ORF Transcript_26146/g.30210 Transcript_26146/m.30210 type:complete len:169 (+) Transcript_26146:167-673(+)
MKNIHMDYYKSLNHKHQNFNHDTKNSSKTQSSVLIKPCAIKPVSMSRKGSKHYKILQGIKVGGKQIVNQKSMDSESYTHKLTTYQQQKMSRSKTSAVSDDPSNLNDNITTNLIIQTKKKPQRPVKTEEQSKTADNRTLADIVADSYLFAHGVSGNEGEQLFEGIDNMD